MCGRFTHMFKWAELVRLMRLTSSLCPIDLSARYNVAPTQTAPVVRQDASGNRTVAALRWGLVPSWADDPAIGSRMINARSEEAAAKPAFRAAMRKRRCLIPVSGFYEWQVVPRQKRKQPWLIRVKDAPLFAFAGLWESWSKGGTSLETFTILTGRPNALIDRIHDRMPVIVPPEMYDRWLDGSDEDGAAIVTAMHPIAASEMEAFPVSTKVNSPANDEPSLVEPVTVG